MIAGQSCGQALVISGQTTETSGPGKGALDHPASGQQNKTTLGFMMLDHLQPNSLLCGVSGSLLSSITLIDEGNLHGFFDHFLHRLRQLFHLRPVLFVGGG